jgi:hypothetical protein
LSFSWNFFCNNSPKEQDQKENERPNSPKKRNYKKKLMVHVACSWMT